MQKFPVTLSIFVPTMKIIANEVKPCCATANAHRAKSLFWMKLLREWFNDSFIKTMVYFLNESMFLNDSVDWIIQWLIHYEESFVLFLNESQFLTNHLNRVMRNRLPHSVKQVSPLPVQAFAYASLNMKLFSSICLQVDTKIIIANVHDI